MHINHLGVLTQMHHESVMSIRGVKSTRVTHSGNAGTRLIHGPVLVDTAYDPSIMGFWLWNPRESTFQPLGRSDGRAAEKPAYSTSSDFRRRA